MKIAVIGAGIAGMAAARQLHLAGMQVSLFEAGSYFGGHSNTVDVTVEGQRFGVDTGFLVFNERTYPNLIALFEELGVPSVTSDMSFSVKLENGLEWAGADLDTVFAQRRNLLRPQFWGMLRDILRFNRAATAIARGLDSGGTTLGAYLDRHGYGAAFRDWYLLPMAACIWSCPVEQMLAFPLLSFARFCDNHGLLQLTDRPQWRTVRGGSRVYVERLLAQLPDKRLATPVLGVARVAGLNGGFVRVRHTGGSEMFDHVVLACHSDQALALLEDARHDERSVLGAIRYQPNHAVLHTDASCLPRARKAWSAWNYERGGQDQRVCVHYLLNMLQPLPVETPVVVSLNPVHAPDPRQVLAEFEYAHPVFDDGALAAQLRLGSLQGRDHTWFAGAWTGYGFHEDGLKSGLEVAARLTDLHEVAQHAAA
ncbi:NAD(P)/FAD-dependent oxidoreductase [Massilia sp. TS11]|uniref:NAD(P)/FAD-dependent oxidoreductase n=1 Tax=Massilia sp. TS11 TaxID=2908003 RepID=UPI001EDAD0E4|nr:FAD-dependent oxidoreductase [Massilia sp. TS11]MCG2585339.1 FAD-dependent oxidoreductase [Massilia sp. TS11]